jgi:hypothetical protein
MKKQYIYFNCFKSKTRESRHDSIYKGKYLACMMYKLVQILPVQDEPNPAAE